jgi:uncharacterized protein (DUF2237 family)
MRKMWALALLISAARANPNTQCGCAANVQVGSFSCDRATKDACTAECSGGCGTENNICPFAGAARDGWCHEPGGTHKICAKVSESLLGWFKSRGNDLSAVVAPGGGWCLCKHWTRGALCCASPHNTSGILDRNDFDWDASDVEDDGSVEVRQIRDYINNQTDANFCAMCESAPTAGCPEQLPAILAERGCGSATPSSPSSSPSPTAAGAAISQSRKAGAGGVLAPPGSDPAAAGS